jgi:ABC-type multidrug transport system fused ATPase/permease subunit
VWLLSSNRITLGSLLVFLVYLVELYGPVRGISRLTNSAFTAAAGAERIAELLDEQPQIADRGNVRALPLPRGAVALEGVTFRYPGAEHDVLREVSFRCEPGEVVALVGPSGAGKSTIAKLLVRFYDPRSGVVTLDGHGLRELRLADVRRAVTLLLQEALLFDATIRENIAFARSGASDAQVEAAARAAAAHEFIVKLPGGYDARVGQKGRILSGGQRQRIAIARAFARDAPVLVLDEPATGLDAHATSAILDPLRRVMRGRATVVIAHNLLTVRDADRILVLDRGGVVAQGTHEQLLCISPLYAHLWRLHGSEATIGEAA